MAPFRFRLESLLKLRVAERDRRREELANAYRADQILQQQLSAIMGEIARTRQQTKEQSAPGAIHVDMLLHSHRYELILQAQRQQIARQQQVIAAETERRRQALVEADRELRILEKLREKHALEYAFNEHKAEVRLLDEIALRRTRANLEADAR
jgi:flagellar protein FliJ